jgi:hypothetical protein
MLSARTAKEDGAMKKKALLPGLIGALLLLAVFPAGGTADVDVHVGVYASPPVYEMRSPPAVVVIPGTYVYFVPGIEVNILFYRGYWYRPYEGRWYRSGGYDGPWKYIPHSRVPAPLLDLPPDYHGIPPGHRRIPYGQLKKDWNRWEREKYWERDERWRRGRQEREEMHGEKHGGHGNGGRGNK